VAIVSEGTMAGERTLLSTLEVVADDMAREEVRPPAIVVVGDVVAVARPDVYGG
jgi:uroporphyrin-III C-methyltransferase/precorrin-2 dehydrogenase/sirohydrochlorin ferrochelatase